MLFKIVIFAASIAGLAWMLLKIRGVLDGLPPAPDEHASHPGDVNSLRPRSSFSRRTDAPMATKKQ